MRNDRLLICGILLVISQALMAALEPIPDKLVVLTFDDSVASQFTVVRPILKEHKFGATFFITEGFNFHKDKTNYMSWHQIAQLHADGFEIGNHTRDHMSMTAQNLVHLKEQIEAINASCLAYGIPRPTSFAWPGNTINENALRAMRNLGLLFARRGGTPEFPYEGGRGVAFEAGVDHPLLIPSAGDARPDWKLEDFIRAVEMAKNGKIAVLQFHGVPDKEHPWVSASPELFRECMKYLKKGNFEVIAMRDLAKYVDPKVLPESPMKVIEERKGKLK